MPCCTRYGAPSSPRGGLRLSMVTLSTRPSAAARTASRPSSAPVGTTMRAPVSCARRTRCMRGSSAPTEAGTNTRPASIAGPAICSNTAAGAASTTISASASRQRHHARRRAEIAQVRRRLGPIARRHGDEPQPIHAGVQRARQLQPDGPEPADRDRLRHVSPSAMARAIARSSGVLTLRNGSHFAPAKSTCRMPICAAKWPTSRRPGADSTRAQLVAAGDRPERHQMVRPPIARRAGRRRRQRARPDRAG